jgi:NADPH:quinone reductase-like Zn-dependent oxidoreductase
MKAAICRRYGLPSVITIKDLPDPLPGRGEVLVAIVAAGVTSAATDDSKPRDQRALGPQQGAVAGIAPLGPTGRKRLGPPI